MIVQKAVYLEKHPELQQQKQRYLISGHSLGGAAANLFAVDLMKKGHAKEDVYAYTFGALNSITEAYTRNDYGNIHNIINELDSFGPYGDTGVLVPGGGFAQRFGSVRLFKKDYAGKLRKDDFCTHVIESYIDAVRNDLIPL